MCQEQLEIYRDSLWKNHPEWFVNEVENVMRKIHLLTNDFGEDDLEYEELASFDEIFDSSENKELTLQRLKLAVEYVEQGINSISAAEQILAST